MKLIFATVVMFMVCIQAAFGIPCNENRPYCNDCYEDMSCKECFDGYYLHKSIPPVYSGGYCVACRDNCLLCETGESCKKCKLGYLNSELGCLQCEPGCIGCEGRLDKCTSCVQNYKMDEEGECYFRYSVIILLLSGIVFITLIACLCRCLAKLARDGKPRSSTKRSDQIISVLGDEFKSHPTLISDVTGIGRSIHGGNERDHDLSNVEETHVAHHIHEDSIQDVFGYVDEEPKQGKKGGKNGK